MKAPTTHSQKNPPASIIGGDDDKKAPSTMSHSNTIPHSPPLQTGPAFKRQRRRIVQQKRLRKSTSLTETRQHIPSPPLNLNSGKHIPSPPVSLNSSGTPQPGGFYIAPQSQSQEQSPGISSSPRLFHIPPPPISSSLSSSPRYPAGPTAMPSLLSRSLPSGGGGGSSSPSFYHYMRQQRRRDNGEDDEGQETSDDGGRRFVPLIRQNSNPFLQKPLSLASSTESLKMLHSVSSCGSFSRGYGSMQERPQTPPAPPSDSSGRLSPTIGLTIDADDPLTSSLRQLLTTTNSPLLSPTHHPEMERHLTLYDLIAVGVGGTLATGIFIMTSFITSSLAGPATILSYLLSSLAALLSGCAFAELSSQIPAAGSAYAYVYASIGELPAVVAACCLTLEYAVSAGAVARGWGQKVTEWIAESADEGRWWYGVVVDPGWNFNLPAFVISVGVSLLLLGGVKESKAVTNYVTLMTMSLIVGIIVVAFTAANPMNWVPFVPKKFGMSGVLRGATPSFMGFLGYDEVCCLTGEAQNPQKNMPRAILLIILTLTTFYITATLAITGLQHYSEIDPVGGFPLAFASANLPNISLLTSISELLTLPLVVLVAVMAQPRLQYALAIDGLMPLWFAEIDETTGGLTNGTLFAGGLMTVIASFVPMKYLNDAIASGVLVAFIMTNSSLLLLRLENPVGKEGRLENLVGLFNLGSLALSLFATTMEFDGSGGGWAMVAMVVGCVGLLGVCGVMKVTCPEAEFFGGRTRRTTTQHMTVGVVPVKEEEFRTPFLPFLPCLGIFVNWYLIAQLSWDGLMILLIYLFCAVTFYFSFGYYYSVGNNGGWDIILSLMNNDHATTAGGTAAGGCNN